MAADLVNAYYEGIARKDGWQKPLSDSLRFKQTTLDALEIWTATDNRLASLTIYFDTAAFSSFMRQA